MYISPFDEPLGRPDEFSMRIARNQQILLQEEVHLKRVVDPAGGSYYVESLTDSVAREAWSIFQQIESEGGMLEAIIKGHAQSEIKKMAEKKRKLITQRRTPIVGVSNYASKEVKPREASYISKEDFLQKRRERLQRLKAVRKNSDVQRLCNRLREALINENQNVLEVAIEAAKVGATIGEITQALTEGSPVKSLEVEILPVIRAAMPFEEMRDRAARCEKETGQMPTVTLLLFGNFAMRRARADFCLSFFRAGGFEVVELPPMESLDPKALADALSVSPIVVACSDDDSYPKETPEILEKIKAVRQDADLIIAGNPASAEELKEMGVHSFVHMRCDVVETLTELLDHLGVTMEESK